MFRLLCRGTCCSEPSNAVRTAEVSNIVQAAQSALQAKLHPISSALYHVWPLRGGMSKHTRAVPRSCPDLCQVSTGPVVVLKHASGLETWWCMVAFVRASAPLSRWASGYGFMGGFGAIAHSRSAAMLLFRSLGWHACCQSQDHSQQTGLLQWTLSKMSSNNFVW